MTCCCMYAAIGSSRSDAPSVSRHRCRNILESSRRWRHAIPILPRSVRATTRWALPPLSRHMARNCPADAISTEEDELVLEETTRENKPMLNTAQKTEASGAEQELTDGFHLVIDALKLNGIDTIYGVPGIP